MKRIGLLSCNNLKENLNHIKAIKFLILLSFVFVFTQKPNAQNNATPLVHNFVIVNNKYPEKADFFEKSIAAADMEQYRLRDKRVHLEFENGFEVELYSAKELFMKGIILNINNYPVTNGGGQTPIFGILPNGHLSAKVFTESKK